MSFEMPTAEELKVLAGMPQVGERERQRLLRVATERIGRKSEALAIWRPLPQQMPFFMSKSKFRIVRGGNRSGKSMSAFAEVASAATGMPIIGPDGNPLPFSYPKDRALLIWLVGWDETHIGGTIHRMLFTDQAFRMIRDENTKEWRCWRPWQVADKKRENETKFAPPLIPPRFIDPKGWGWDAKGQRIFKVCRLMNGTEIHAFSSYSNPRQGDAVDLLMVDEDIQHPEHVSEWKRRLMDNHGRFIWAAFPHSKNNALIEMSEHAHRLKDEPDPSVSEVVLTTTDNPYIDEKEKEIAKDLSTEDEQRARDAGEFLTDNFLVYPSFAVEIHGTPPKDKLTDKKIDEAIRANALEPPDDWTRYLVLDPGHTVAAVLFAAVPPPEFGDHLVVYDELYMKRSDSDSLAAEVLKKVQKKYFELFLIDFRAGRQTPGGFMKNIRQQYTDSFVALNIQCARTGHGFQFASDNLLAGIGLVREALSVRSNGRPKLLFVADKLPWLRWEINRYKKRIMQNNIKDDPVDRDNHLMDCLRYCVAADPQYVKPDMSKINQSPAYRAYQEFLKAGKKQDNSVCLGPGAAA